MTILSIYTDGACSGNQNETNIGGWGAILEFGAHRKELCGGAVNTTNNRMEMTALLEAFQAIRKDGQIIEVYCDSAYLMDCFRQKWYVGWIRNGWKTKSKKAVSNQDLWEQLLPYLPRHNMTFYRVKGHVHLNHPSTKSDQLYKKFVQWNGSRFTFEDFSYITEMNNRADALANEGMDTMRSRSKE